MKIISRYILWQVFLFFSVSLLLMTSAFLLYYISEATIAQGLPLYISVRLIPYILPYLFSVTLPVATLLAGTLIYGKMSGTNEMIALKAMGVPPWRVFLPTWIFAIAVSVFAVWMNDLGFAWGMPNAERVAIEGTETMILKRLAAEGKFSDRAGNISLTVSGVTRDGVLLQPTFSGKVFSGEGIAERGRLSVDFTRNEPSIRIELTDVIFKNHQGTGLLPQTMTFESPLSQFGFGISPGDPPMAKVDEIIREFQAQKERSRRRLAAQTAFALAAGDLLFAESGQWQRQKEEEAHLDRQIIKSAIAVPRRWSSGFSCFFFIWVGIPVAVWLNRPEYLAGFFACFLPILIAYYPLLMLGLNGAKSGLLPPVCCWIGNVVLALAGFWFLKRIHRH